jgi:hypothetical protein
MIEAKAFRTFMRIFSLLISELLSAKIKLTLHKAVQKSNNVRLSRLGISGKTS